MTTRGRLGVTIASGLVACLAGCSLVTALSDLDSRYAPPAPSLDGGADAAGGDGSSTGDASPDAGDGATTDARTDSALCVGDAHALCDDFDTLPLGAAPTWTTVNLGKDGAELSLATDIVSSPPRALSTVIRTDAGGVPEASLTRAFLGPLAALDCSFQIRPEWLDSKGLTEFAVIALPPPPATGYATAAIELRLVDTRIDLRIGAPFADGGTGFSVQRDLGPPLVGQWLTMRLRLSGLTSTPRIQMWLGGNLAEDEPLTLGPVARAELSLGVVNGIGGDKDWRVSFDDVVCDVTPP